jgi:magnesium transporter
LPDKIEEVINQSDLYSDTSDTATVLAQADKVELALLPESLPIQKRIILWQTILDHKKLDVLIEMRSNPRSVLIHAPEPEHWDVLFTDIDAEALWS